MKTLLFFSIGLFIGATAFSQNKSLQKNKWSNWEADTVITHEGTINVINKRIKISSSNCLITEEIILFHDACNTVIRKIKIRSDCKRNIGEGNVIFERKYRSNCDTKSTKK